MAKVILRAGKILAAVTVLLILVFVVVLSFWTNAQTDGALTEVAEPNEPQLIMAGDVYSETRSEVVARRGRNRRVWEVVREVAIADEVDGQVEVEEHVSRIVEVGTGICYEDQQGDWQVTDASWRPTDTGFVMDRAGYILEIDKTAGSWLKYTVEGEVMHLRPDKVVAFDGQAMETVALLDETVEGVIDPDDSAKLVFPDAFGEGVDLELEVQPSGYHQNVIFHNQPLLSENLDVATTKIHLFTEMNLDDYDTSGMVDIVVGTSDRVQSAELTGTLPTKDDITFVKLFEEDGQTYEYDLHRFAASEVFDNGSGSQRQKAIADKSLVKDDLGRSFLVETLDESFFETASYPVTWDYVTTSGNFDPNDSPWYADATYYVSDDFEVDEEELRIEPGTFVKFATGKKLFTSGTGKIIARGEPYLPVYFTSKDDNDNGETIAGSDGSPGSGDWVGLQIDDDSEIEFCGIYFAETAIQVNGAPGIPLRHIATGASKNFTIEITSSVGSDDIEIFNNALISNYGGTDPTAIKISGTGGTVNIINNTIDLASKGIAIDAACTRQITAKNNIMISCSTAGIYAPGAYDPNYLSNNYNGYYDNTADISGVFSEPNSVTITETPWATDTVELFGRCLNTNANGGAKFIDAGSCSVEVAGFDDPNLWETLYCENVYTTAQTISMDTTWQPDPNTCDTGTVDLGSHIPRIDYLIYKADITVSGATLTVKPGTVIAQRINDSTDAGKLIISSNAELICNGDPFGDGYITWSEQGLAGQYWATYFKGVAADWDTYVDIQGDYEITFSKFRGMGCALVLTSNSGTIRDCIFDLHAVPIYALSNANFTLSNNLFLSNNRAVHADSSTGSVTNCTFDRSTTFGVVTGGSGSDLDITNCLFRKMAYEYTGSYAFAAITDWDSAATINESHNVFYENFMDFAVGQTASTAGQDLDSTDWTDDTGAAEAHIISGDPFDSAWTVFSDKVRLDQNGDAVEHGYDPESVGMRGYTTALDDSVDDPNMDIGYHYPIDLDTDGEGLYDYEEYWIGSDPDIADSDGDGLSDYLEVMVYGTSPLLVDTDSDGMPDGWEVLYTNSNATSSDASADLENGGTGDGVSNLDEYRYGLDPDVDNEGDYFTVYEYDDAGQVTLQRDIEVEGGAVFVSETNPEYDVLGRQTLQRRRAYPGIGPNTGADDSDDMITLKTYDIAGNLKKTVAKAPLSNDSTVIDPNDIVTENFYNSLGRITKVTDAVGQDTTYTYTTGGRVAAVTDPNGAVTTNVYDNSGRLEKVINALGHYRTMEYDSMGRVFRQISWNAADSALLQKRTVYDDMGHVVTQAVLASAASAANYVIDPNTDSVVEYSYDDAYGTYPGMLVGTKMYYGYDSTSGLSQTAETSYDYDYLGRRYKTTDPDDNETILSYDSAGRVQRRQQKDYHPLGGGTDLVLTRDFEFDDNGRVIKVTAKPSTDPNYSSAWQETQFKYALGHRIEETKPNGVVTTHSFDVLGRKFKTVADSDSGEEQTTEWVFDRVGRQVSIAGYTDEDDNDTKQVTAYDYDKLRHVVTITYPDTKTIAFAYDNQGKVKRRTDQQDIVTYYKYDKLRAMTLRTTDPAEAGDPIASDPNYVPDPDRTTEMFTYDGLARMLTAYKTIDANDVSLVEFAYNDIGRVTDFDQTHFDKAERQIDYSYDQTGFLESTLYPDGSTTIDRTNDWKGRIDTLERSSTELVDYAYIGARVAQRSYDVPSIDYEPSYDNLGRITEIDYGASVVNFDYSYVSNESNIYRKTFDHRISDPYNEYSYDDLDRLTGVTYHDSDTEAFNMDDLGNRDGNQTLRDDGTVNFVVDDDTNRYTSIGGNSISHDDAGNLTADKDGYTYEYDYENRVVKIEDSSSNDVAEYAYDALGRRIRVIDSKASTTTLYYYNPEWQVLAEYDNANNLQRYFIYGNYIDEPLVMNDGTDDYYYAHDHLYSTVALIGYVDSAWTVVERYEYDAYGKMTRLDPDFTAWSGTEAGNPYYFTSRRLDVLDSGSLEVMYYRHRYYDTYAGRFLQHDPLGYVDGIDLYEYVGSAPVRRTDPTGLVKLPPQVIWPFPQPPGIPGLPPGIPDLTPGPPGLGDPVLPPVVTPFPFPYPDPLPEPGGTDPGVSDCTPWKNNGPYYKGQQRDRGCVDGDILESLGPIASITGGALDVVMGMASALGVKFTTPVCNLELKFSTPGVYPDMPCECRIAYNRKCKRKCCHWYQIENKKTRVEIRGYGYAWDNGNGTLTCACSYPEDYMSDRENILETQTQCDQFNK